MLVHSEYGKGSKFTACFSYHPVIKNAPANELSLPDDDEPDLSETRVLVVEDNVINQVIIQKMLGNLGIDCDIVGDGFSCIEQLATQDYDLILMDLNMPGKGGLETTREIHQLIPGSNRPRIIAVTANVLEGDEQRCVDAGMDAFLPKPITIAALSDKIFSVLEKQLIR
jgi:CheY-like chemotaxis protein